MEPYIYSLQDEQELPLENDLQLDFPKELQVNNKRNSIKFSNLSYKNKQLYVHIPKFSSPGIVKSDYSDLRESLLVANTESLQNFLQRIQDYVNGLMRNTFSKTNCGSLPDEWIETIHQSGIGNLDHTRDFYFFRLAREAEGFNERTRKSIEAKNSKAGQYQALVHVTGIYFGKHQDHDFLAYLQVKVKQWTFERALHATPGMCIIPHIKQTVPLEDGTSLTLEQRKKKKRSASSSSLDSSTTKGFTAVTNPISPSTSHAAKEWTKSPSTYIPKANEGPSMYEADDDMDSNDTDEVEEDM